MRIVHWYPNYLGGGGVANAVLGLARAQSALGHDVVVAAAAPSGSPLYEPMRGVRVETWPYVVRLAAAGATLRVISRHNRRALRALDPDVVHVHGEFNADNWWAPHVFDAPIVLSPQGAFNPVVLAKTRSRAKRAYIAVADRLMYRRTAAIHALNPREEEHVRSLLPTARVYCVPQGGNPAARADSRERCDSSRLRLLYVGRLDVFTKGLDICIEAVALAARRVRQATLVLTLVGPDWRGGRAALETLGRARGVDVVFAGALAGDAVGRALGDADIYVQLSRHEGAPLAVSEALSAGLPAVLSDAIGSVSFLEIATLPHVRVVPPDATSAGAAIADVAADVDRLREIGGARRDELRDFFSWERAARLHADEYARLAEAA